MYEGDYLKVVYLSKDKIKVVKGILIKEDFHFKYIQGLYMPITIGKNFIIQITTLPKDDEYIKIKNIIIFEKKNLLKNKNNE